MMGIKNRTGMFLVLLMVLSVVAAVMFMGGKRHRSTTKESSSQPRGSRITSRSYTEERLPFDLSRVANHNASNAPPPQASPSLPQSTVPTLNTSCVYNNNDADYDDPDDMDVGDFITNMPPSPSPAECRPNNSSEFKRRTLCITVNS